MREKNREGVNLKGPSVQGNVGRAGGENGESQSLSLSLSLIDLAANNGFKTRCLLFGCLFLIRTASIGL